MSVFRGTFLGLVVVTLVVSATLSGAHLEDFNFGSGGSHGLLPQFYKSSCPQVNDSVISVLQWAIEKDLRAAASLLRLHCHDCFALVSFHHFETNQSKTVVEVKPELRGRYPGIQNCKCEWFGKQHSSTKTRSLSPNSRLRASRQTRKSVCPRRGGDNTPAPLDFVSPTSSLYLGDMDFSLQTKYFLLGTEGRQLSS
ncbi:hypothetical protein DVH24_020182 [Malus domestica]|uniref:peroxidase n=1 Tax=Malus domestica TaxID=3750 RepID=A0A498J5X0_MALDO|nr:hypothetical protein DVH24_020182 [Malus domestica]